MLNFCAPHHLPRGTNSADVFAKIESLYVKLKRHSLAPAANIAYLNVCLADLAQTFVNTTVDSQSFLWQEVHFESAKQLKINNDIVLTRPDKATGVVILNRADYVSKMDAIMEDTNKFLKLGDLSFDDSQKIENKQQKRFLGLFRSKLISKEVYEFIRPVGSQRPRMYGWPKIHKSCIPLWPILSMCYTAQHPLAKWLVEVLNPVLTPGVALWTLLHFPLSFVNFPFVWSPNFRSLLLLSHFCY